MARVIVSAAAGFSAGETMAMEMMMMKKKKKKRLLSTCSSSLKPPPPIVVTGNPPTFVSAPGRRIVAIGDVHGDISQARCALQLAGLLSDHDNTWTGGPDVLVQLGDILDRGPDEIAILSLFRSLHAQALSQGGAVFHLNGNHETMNVEGDFRYVHSQSFDECTHFLDFLELCENNWEHAFLTWVSVSQRWKQDITTSSNHNHNPWDLLKKQKGVMARSILLKPGGPLACELARHPVVLKVNDWIFCHGGMLPHHVAYGMERLNRDVSHWMRATNETDDGSPSIPFIATRGYDSVVWNRLYSRDTSDLEDYQIHQIHSILEETLQAVGAKAMVVGHTPQYDGVNCKYNCSLWRVDVGMSSGVLNSSPEVLEIIENKARVLRSHNKEAFSELQVLDYT